jgi:predicted phosphodiesterase
LVLSDIHANLVALEAVLADAVGQYDAVWCLGDVVGYGPNPNECVALLQTLSNLVCLAGNHDRSVVDDFDLSIFNNEAFLALSWTRTALQQQHTQYLHRLPSLQIQNQFTLVHGSLRDPIWEYLLDSGAIIQTFQLLTTPYCFFGHTHVAVAYHLLDYACDEVLPEDRPTLDLRYGEFLINPGSVGQPRDMNPQAAYGLLDTDAQRFSFKRVAYNIAETQRRMQAYGLPERLVQRLRRGV